MLKKKKNNTTERRPRQANRTLPERKEVFSYHMSRPSDRGEGESRRADPFAPPKPTRTAWWKLLPIYLAIVIIIASVGDLLLLSTNPRVIPLTNTSNAVFLRPVADYQQAAQQLLAQSFLNHNKLTVNASGVAAALQKQFPELSQVSIALPLVGHRPVVYVEPDSPALILVSQNAASYVVASSGKALIATQDLASLNNSKQLPVVTDQSGLRVQLGKAALSSSNVDFIQTIQAQLQAQQIPIRSMVLPSGGGELDVYLSGQPYYAKFNLQGQVDEQVGTFVATKKYLDTKHVTPAQYIDARVPGRSYYK